MKCQLCTWSIAAICSGGCIPNSVCIKPNTCRCRSGHVGAKCKPRAEQCKATCLNGGRCRNGKCKCPKGWTGTYCHHTVGEFSNNVENRESCTTHLLTKQRS